MQSEFVLLAAFVLLVACGDDPSTKADAGPPDVSTDSGADTRDVGDTGTTSTTSALLTLNLHCLSQEGTPFDSVAARLAHVGEVAVESGVEVMLLQEVCQTDTIDTVAMLTSSLESASGATWSSVFADAHLANEGTSDEAREGLAIFVRGSLTSEERYTYLAQEGLQRVLLAATVSTASLGAFRVATLHLDHRDDDVRRAQAEESAVLGFIAEPITVLAGDLNAQPGEPAHDALRGFGYLDESASLRRDRIDHVFVHRQASLESVGATFLFSGASPRVSDHPGVMVRVRSIERSPGAVTLVTARVDVGFGRRLAIRGEAPPLSWDRGLPMINRGADEWVFATTEIRTDFAFKTVVNDESFQTGPNEMGTAGAPTEVTPLF